MDILEINEEKKYVRCEPMVSVQRLFEALQAKGYDVQYIKVFWKLVFIVFYILLLLSPMKIKSKI